MSLNIYKFLFEAEESENRQAPEDPVSVKEPEVKARPSTDSVDDQIDALLLRYENASIREEDKDVGTLSESLGYLNLKALLREQEEDLGEEDLGEEEGGEEGGEEEEAPDPAGSEDMTVTDPAEEQEVPPLFRTARVRHPSDRHAAHVVNPHAKPHVEARLRLDRGYELRYINSSAE